MILGRNSGLWAGLIQAFLNVVAAGWIVLQNAPLNAYDLAFFAALNSFSALCVAVIANASDPTTAGILGRRIVTPTIPATTVATGAASSGPSKTGEAS